MKITGRLYKVNKGDINQPAYFATLKKQEIEKFNLVEGDAILLKSADALFPTFVRKLKTSKGRFMLGFTVPYKIGNTLIKKTDISFNYYGRNIYLKNESYDRKKLNLIHLIPEKSIRGFPIFLFDNYKEIFVWIYSKGNKIISLPKTITLTEQKYDILELAGAFFCEGFKSRKQNKHRDRFSFSNADLNQIKWFVEAAERLLNIKREQWSIQILYPKNNPESIKYVRSLWSSFGLQESKMSVVKNVKTNDLRGVCILNIYNSSLAESFYYIAEECQKLAIQSKNNAIRFFRGLSRGDLGISEHNRIISFTTESYENALFFRKICELMEINTSNPRLDSRGKKGCWNVYIFGRRNFEKLIDMGCITHQLRLERLFNKLSKYRNKS